MFARTDPNAEGAEQFGSGDDDFPCTFPPTEFSCPAPSGTAPYSGQAGLMVLSYGSCTGDIGEYVLSVTVNGSPVTPSVVFDELVWPEG